MKWLGLLLLLPWPIGAQGEFKISTDVDLVMVEVGVKDANNRFVTGLAQSNFHLSDNGHARTIRYFGKADLPATIGLVIDNSGSMAPKLATVSQAAAGLIQASNPRDEVFTVLFNDHVRFGLPPEQPFTSNVEEMVHAIRHADPAGRTALYDGLKAALERVHEGSKGRRALVLISDGGDNASRTTLAQIKERVEASPAAIYTVGVFEEDDPDRNPGILRHLAEMSGGEYFHVSDIMELPPVCKTIAEDIRNTYTLAFTPPPDARPTFHRLKVTVTPPAGGGHLAVRARTSYLSGIKGSLAYDR